VTSGCVVLVGDAAVSLEFPERIDRELNAQVISAADALREAAVPGVRDIVPTFRSLTVNFDPLKTDVAAVVRVLEAGDRKPPRIAESASAPIRIPVRYGGSDGPDLEDVARMSRLETSDVIMLHAGAVYRVFMLGFLPGFA